MLYTVRSKLRREARSKAAPDFGNITGMVDGMIDVEEEEQEGDDKQKPWCNGEFEKEDREAKNKLQKFYNPALYKPPPKKELSAEDQIIANLASFAQIAAHRHRVPEPEAPEGLGGYEKKTQKSGGVMALMDMIVKDLDASLSDTEHEESTAQKDYVEIMADSQASRATATKGITDKEAAKSELNAKKVAAKEKEVGDFKDLDIIHKYVVELHGSCDFILENYGIRKEARKAEVESLKNAKAILSGAVLA